MTDNSLENMLDFDHPAHQRAHKFLVEEAYVLDRRDFDTWLKMMTDDITYRVPVTSTFGSNPHKSGEMDHMLEDRYSLGKRIERLKSKYAWTESPPSRTRHLVSNVACFSTDDDAETRVMSALLVYRTQGADQGPDLICGMREDILRNHAGQLQLAARTVTLDQSVLQTQNLAIFL